MLNVNLDYLINMNFRNAKGIPILQLMNNFNQEVLSVYNKCKVLKLFSSLSTDEQLRQPLWGNEYFKHDNCLCFKKWAKSGILYIKDLFSNDGNLLGDTELLDKIGLYPQVLSQVSMFKKYISKKLKEGDYTNARHVQIKPTCNIVYRNKVYNIKDKRSSFFYNIFKSKLERKGNMESIYSKQFVFENSIDVWKSIYEQKMKHIKTPKLAEFNFKLLHNIIPNGFILSKYGKSNSNCSYCNLEETTFHMLYECARVKHLWSIVSHCLGIDIKWKQVICGFPLYVISDKFNI